MVRVTGLWSVMVTSLDNCWKASCLPGAAGFRATDEWQAVKPGSMQPGTFKSILTAALEEFYVQEERPQSVRSWCWTAASYVIPAKWGINEVSLRLIRNENKFVLYIDLKGTTTESKKESEGSWVMVYICWSLVVRLIDHVAACNIIMRSVTLLKWSIPT